MTVAHSGCGHLAALAPLQLNSGAIVEPAARGSACQCQRGTLCGQHTALELVGTSGMHLKFPLARAAAAPR